jgi:hypothetical protein
MMPPPKKRAASPFLPFAAFFGGMALLWRVIDRPLSIEYSGDYYSDGAGDLRFEFAIQGETPRPKKIASSSPTTAVKPNAQK